MMMNKRIAVFLNKKLITCDTIVPFLYELKSKHPKTHIDLYVGDRDTYKIIQQNFVLWDAIRKIADFECLGPQGSSRLSGQLSRIARWMKIGLIGISILLNRTRIIHFKALNEYPMKLLYTIRPASTFLFQGGLVSLSPQSQAAFRVIYPQQAEETKKRLLKPVAAGTLVGFDEGWEEFRKPEIAGVSRFTIEQPHQRTPWLEYLSDVGSKYLSDIGIEADEDFGVFILSSMHSTAFLKDPDGFPELFEETLNLLFKFHPNLLIVVKQHPATEPDILLRQQEIISRMPLQKIIVSNIHPSVLASRARFFIGNSASTTFVEAKRFDVPTIEYTDYSKEVLEKTDGNSINPAFVDHFIERDQQRLSDALENASANTQREKPVQASSCSLAYLELMNKLAG
jgi:hypothetical protein